MLVFSLKKSMDFPCLQVDVDIVEARPGGQSRHRGHGAHQREEEPGPHARPHVPDGQGEPGGGALKRGVGAEAQVGLGHADGEVGEALALIPFDFHLENWMN